MIRIERAVPADAAMLLEYLKQIGEETDNVSFGAEGLSVTVEEEASYIEAMEKSKDSVIFVAKADGRIIGDVSLSRLHRRMKHRSTLGISVIKSYWNQGIGGQMLEKAIEFAREQSIEMIELEVRSDNARAIHLYEKYGFKKLFTYPEFFKIGEEYIDFDVMRLIVE